jgi:hypothetical protein
MVFYYLEKFKLYCFIIMRFFGHLRYQFNFWAKMICQCMDFEVQDPLNLSFLLHFTYWSSKGLLYILHRLHVSLIIKLKMLSFVIYQNKFIYSIQVLISNLKLKMHFFFHFTYFKWTLLDLKSMLHLYLNLLVYIYFKCIHLFSSPTIKYSLEVQEAHH